MVLGASGCGKSTLLRLVAGLDRPDEGCIRIGDQIVSDDGLFIPSEQRGVGVVFQSYALWPHLSVAEHARFPLDVAGHPRQRGSAASRSGLGHGRSSSAGGSSSFGTLGWSATARGSGSLSGSIGQPDPDGRTPGQSDPHLRSSMEQEILRVRRESGATMLYITHDQREAMALADRIAVLDGGRMRQLASPEQLYAEPADETVACFIGSGSLLPVEYLSSASEAATGRASVRLGDSVLKVRCRKHGPNTTPSTQPGRLLARPEHVELVSATADGDALPARVVSSTYRGDHHELQLVLDSGSRLVARSLRSHEPGTRLYCVIKDAWLVPSAD